MAALKAPSAPGQSLRFTPLTVPVLVKDTLMYGTGFFPLHRDEVYLCERDEQSLVGTAEVPATGLHGDEILEADELPKLYFARSTCFRREGRRGRQGHPRPLSHPLLRQDRAGRRLPGRCGRVGVLARRHSEELGSRLAGVGAALSRGRSLHRRDGPGQGADV